MCDACPRYEWEFTVVTVQEFWQGNPNAVVDPQHVGVELTADMSYPYLRAALARRLANDRKV